MVYSYNFKESFNEHNTNLCEETIYFLNNNICNHYLAGSITHTNFIYEWIFLLLHSVKNHNFSILLQTGNIKNLVDLLRKQYFKVRSPFKMKGFFPSRINTVRRQHDKLYWPVGNTTKNKIIPKKSKVSNKVAGIHNTHKSTQMDTIVIKKMNKKCKPTKLKAFIWWSFANFNYSNVMEQLRFNRSCFDHSILA